MAKKKIQTPAETIEESGKKLVGIIGESAKASAELIQYNNFENPGEDDFDDEPIVDDLDGFVSNAFPINGINME